MVSKMTDSLIYLRISKAQLSPPCLSPCINLAAEVKECKEICFAIFMPIYISGLVLPLFRQPPVLPLNLETKISFATSFFTS
uniref:Uncharacterized protein n=1 Tax=Rhizophora mucronata TaxID=61149 RepID=A0A2P2R2N9_RHIMU